MTDASTAPRFLIRKHGGYYKPNSQGYTSSAIKAGRYTLDEAESITHPNGPDGPRDGMTFVHEDDLQDDDWKAYAALLAERDDARTNTEDAVKRALEAAAAMLDGCNRGLDPADMADDIRALRDDPEAVRRIVEGGE